MVIALLGLIGNPTVGLNLLQKDCDKVNVTIHIEKTTDGQNNGMVRVTLVKGDLRTVKYIFCEESGKVLNESKFETGSMDGLKKGTYFCIVNTSDCSKKISFTIK
jgi:hypothetical protein